MQIFTLFVLAAFVFPHMKNKQIYFVTLEIHLALSKV